MSLTLILFSVASVSAQGLAHGCQDVDLDVASDDAVRALNDDELDWAHDLASSALDQLECVARVVDPEDLATLYQTRAAAGFYAVPQGAYRADLMASAAMWPGWFNDRLGPDLRRAWEQAEVGGSASLRVWPIPDDGVLYVDGHARLEQPVEARPGRHLVQVALGAEVAWVWTGELSDGETRVLETGLPEPTRARVVRDNPLLWGGLVTGVAVGAGGVGTWRYGQRFLLGADGASYYDDLPDPVDRADPVGALDRDWRRYNAMRAGLLVGSAGASAMLMAHALRARRSRERL